MINIMNIQDVHEAGLQKREFAFSSETVQNDDYCLLFKLNLMVVDVQTDCFLSLRVNVPCH